MPDLPDRAERERDLTSAVLLILQRKQAELTDLLGNPPDIRRIPPGFYNSMEANLKTVIAEQLASTYYASAAGVGANTAGLDANARQWAADKAQSLVREFVANTEAAIEEAWRAYEAAETKEYATFAAGALLAFSASRATALAVTETTSTITAAEAWAMEGVATATWVTSGDDSVCPICEPLDGLSQEDWPDEAESGPPAHVNCRCWLEWN